MNLANETAQISLDGSVAIGDVLKALDTAGYPRGEIALERVGSAVKLVFPRDAVWVVLE